MIFNQPSAVSLSSPSQPIEEYDANEITNEMALSFLGITQEHLYAIPTIEQRRKYTC